MNDVWTDIYPVYNRDGSFKRFFFTEDFIRKSGKENAEMATIYNNIKDEDLNAKIRFCSIERTIEHVIDEKQKKLLRELSRQGAAHCLVLYYQGKFYSWIFTYDFRCVKIFE